MPANKTVDNISIYKSLFTICRLNVFSVFFDGIQ